ncbi:helix-turn-helix domain-containing protein [Chryseobacterium indologenes]|uniref:Helix-turn-helix domain-containing protein n=2 Tax=Chryseobacterium group TaxID=2782232 RepID=A0AAD0YVD2_CHRID|nr:helix-turn-helix domain-containing protein [Chryseobacterium indologenes]AZB17975.1 helix-turn-helix domain-containing protein [Chryseobacterium indologenes]
MSKLCGTNTVYLSKIINFYKKKSFNEYLNELRLDHIVSQWKSKPKTRYISIQKTAENAGYNTTQTFTKNFQEKYHIPPTYFLNRLNKEN